MTITAKENQIKNLRREYDAQFVTEPIRDDDRGYRWLARELLSAAPRIETLLDVACGGGYFLREVSRLGIAGRVAAGTDFSLEALRIAQREYSRAFYVLAASEQLPFAAGTFEAVTCLGSLEHFFDIPKAVREMQRAAKNNAVFFILVPNMFWYKDLFSVFLNGYRKQRNQTQERFASLGEWRDLLEQSGLSVIQTKKYNGIARHKMKQRLKDLLIPLKFSYHFLFICRSKQKFS